MKSMLFKLLPRLDTRGFDTYTLSLVLGAEKASIARYLKRMQRQIKFFDGEFDAKS
jgi:hypothetical protein